MPEVALRAYVKIGELPGQSTTKQRQDDKFSDVRECQLLSNTDWKGDVTLENVKTEFGGLRVVTKVNVASPQLMIGSLRKDIYDVTVDTVNQAGETLWKVELTGARISSMEQRWTMDGDGYQVLTFHSKDIKVSCEQPESKEDNYDFTAPQDFPPQENPS